MVQRNPVEEPSLHVKRFQIVLIGSIIKSLGKYLENLSLGNFCGCDDCINTFIIKIFSGTYQKRTRAPLQLFFFFVKTFFKTTFNAVKIRDS